MGVTIPLSEFKARITRLQAEMKKDGFDAILAYGNEAEPQYVRYLSDYWPSFETAGVIVPAEGEPMLLIGPESYTYAADRSVIPEIRLLKAFRESSEPEYPGKPLSTFNSVFDEVMGGRKITKFGVAGLPLMTIGVYNDLAASLKEYGNIEVLKADDVMARLRMIKTEPELACMREAARITKETFDFVLNNIKPGMTECQVAGLALGKMHELGAERESYPLWVLTGEGSNQAISRPRHKIIQPGDMTFLQIGARVAGYASTIGRPVIFGKATEEQKSLIAAGYAGQKIVCETLKAGVCAGDVAAAYENEMERIGYKDWLLYGPCHGNGQMEGEAPWIENGSTWILQENMSFCVDIFLGNNDKKIGLRMEDVVRVTKDGVENLTNYPREVFEL
ncbi:MAG: aminopeptidase P family protein [Clostridia bacterium]|nr:aminopeptidase P family protein [Clostridia bacterium]MBR2973425.1 aminopeptidase P family protein [Clostridia bacterium]MBR3576796.1 aminopeptidase P family protein [Clostridia bacterium]